MTLSASPDTLTCPRRARAFALLVVLLALVVALPVLARMASLSARSNTERHVAANVEQANELLHAAAAPIRAWLEQESSELVLPIDAAEPKIAVLHDRMLIRTGQDIHDIEIRITAWDQNALIPLDEAATPSLLAQTLPNDARALAREVRAADPDGVAGLDLLASPMTITPASWPDSNRSRSRAIFPVHETTEALMFAAHEDGVGVDGEGALRNRPNGSALHETIGNQTAIGALISTHGGDGHRIRLNINTTTLERLQAALRSAGRGGLAMIVESRANGKPAPASAVEAIRSSRDAQSAGSRTHFVASSNCWSFRIDIRVNEVRRSWWEVYRPNLAREWERVQRLVITS